MTLLPKMHQQRLQDRERLRSDTLTELRKVLGELLPGQRVIVFGSLVRAGRFSETSDIDLALESEPPSVNVYELSSLIGERMGARDGRSIAVRMPFPGKNFA